MIDFDRKKTSLHCKNDCRRKRRIVEVEKDDSAEDVDEKTNEFEVGDRPATNKGELFQRDLMSRPTLKWPENYDDLAPITLPPPVKRPAHRGWTHSGTYPLAPISNYKRRFFFYQPRLVRFRFLLLLLQVTFTTFDHPDTQL